VSEIIVTLRNPQGHALHCMFEAPPPGVKRRDVACVLLSPGVKMRVAPHRLYRKMAREFLARGIAVMRVDFHGLGDSGGELPETQLDQLYRQVQLGRHVEDARAALRWLEREQGIRRFVIGGLCGGALTGLLAAEEDSSIVALYAIGIPVILDGTGAHESAHMTQGQLREMRATYLTKLLQPSAWLRLFTFRSSFRTILRSLLPKQRGAAKPAAPAAAGLPAPTTALAANLNPRFAPALFRLLGRGAPSLLIFSGADRLHPEYLEKFVAPWAGALSAFGDRLRVDLVPKANHVLGDPAWVDAARKLTADWLDRHLP
jgi:alpha-beta hydrolase superfamily lysophospholipase